LALVTFDTTNFEFSTAFELGHELSLELFYEEGADEGHHELKDDIYYFYHNVLKDVLLIVTDKVVYIIKQQINATIYIFIKKPYYQYL